MSEQTEAFLTVIAIFSLLMLASIILAGDE